MIGIAVDDGLVVKEGVVIPKNEIEFMVSRSGGAGGQHVNKTDSRVTVRWNVLTTVALQEAERVCILEKMKTRLTNDGYVVIHADESRSQLENKRKALERLAFEIAKALVKKKKRVATKISTAVKTARAEEKKRRSKLKMVRSKKRVIED